MVFKFADSMRGSNCQSALPTGRKFARWDAFLQTNSAKAMQISLRGLRKDVKIWYYM